MRFKVLQQDLYPALQSVARSCSVKAQLPVLGNILLSVADSKLTLSATNLEIGVVKSITVENLEDGDITIPHRTILDIISNLPLEEIELSAQGDLLTITTKSFSSQINGISAAEFPNIPLAGKEAVTLDPKLLTSGVPQVSFATAVDEGRPILTGVYTQIQNKKLQLVSTDGFRLAAKTVNIDDDQNFKALIPRKTYEEVLRLLGEEEVDQVNISTSDDQNQMIFSFGNTQLSSRLIEGQFPTWEKIIPSQIVARMVVEKTELLKAVKLASVFARNESNVLRIENSDGKLILSSEAKELGSQKNEIEAQTEGEALVIAFNAKYILEALNALPSSQAILEASGPLSATIIKPMGDEGLQYIIMPINLG